MMVVIVMRMVMVLMAIVMRMVMVLMAMMMMTVSTRHLDSWADLICRCHHRHHHLQLPCPWCQNGRSQYLRLLLSFFIIIAFNCIWVNPEVITSLYFREIS